MVMPRAWGRILNKCPAAAPEEDRRGVQFGILLPAACAAAARRDTSRNYLTNLLIAAIRLLTLDFGSRVGLAFQDRIGQLLHDQLDRANAVVIARDRQIHRIRIAVGVDQSD